MVSSIHNTAKMANSSSGITTTVRRPRRDTVSRVSGSGLGACELAVVAGHAQSYAVARSPPRPPPAAFVCGRDHYAALVHERDHYAALVYEREHYAAPVGHGNELDHRLPVGRPKITRYGVPG